MIHALKQMGDYVKENSNESMLSQIVENPDSTGDYDTVLFIVFKSNSNQGVFFDRIRVEEFTTKKLSKYAYKYGSSRGGDLTPTSKITDLKKTFKRIKRPLNKLSDNIEGNTKEENIILSINEIMNDEIKSNQIYKKLENVEYDNSAILSIAIEVGGQLKYVGDFDKFTESLIKKYEKKFYYKSSYLKAEKESVGENNVCYICSKNKEHTYGYVGTFSFYTLDKKGFTTGGFNRGEAWKNYPVCSECAKTLDLGKDYLENNLSARFCGVNYFIIPKTIFSSQEQDREEMFEILEDLEEHKKISLEEDTRSALTNAQDDIFETMSDFDNYVNFNLMFYEEQNSAFRILLYIEDVLPSYLQKIFQTKKEVEKDEIFKNLKGKNGLFDLSFKFNLISNFFYVNLNNKPDYTKQFLEITNKIFKGKTISYQILIDRFISHLREKFKNNENTNYDNLKALMILKFLKQLELLSGGEESNLTNIEVDTEYKKRIQDFLKKHSDVLDSDIKNMVFLEGVLAKKLLNIQQQERNSAPFRARLNNLKLNEKIVKRLYSEIINKLEEYDKNYYNQLEEMIADYILTSDFEGVSNDELSFYFVTGMNQAHKFDFKNNNEEE